MFLKSSAIKNKKALLRVDLNVAKGEDWRIEIIRPTILYVRDLASRVTVISHLGRPGGRIVQNLSLEPIKKRLPKGVNLLENIRFDPREEANDESLAKELSIDQDVFINDAFSVSHRGHASIVSLPIFLPSFLGPLFKKEIDALEKDFQRPLVFMLGGGKIETKLPLVDAFLEKGDHVLLGGLIANAILNKETKITSVKLHLPVDAVTEEGVRAVGRVDSAYDILDIGPDTVRLFGDIIAKAKTIIWNGPMGKFEDSRFRGGTLGLIEFLKTSSAYKIVGGGESIDIIDDLNLENSFGHISSGGGAMLEFLAKGTLPGIEAVKNQK